MTIPRKAFLLVLLVTLVACAGMPIGTMIRLARFDLEDLQKVDPAEIRAAIRTHADFQPGEARLSLKIDLADGGETLLDEQFSLQQMPDWAARAHQLKSLPEDRHWIVFRLQEEDLARFQGMQQQLLTLGNDNRGKSLTMNVGTDNSEFPKGVKSIPFGVDLQLAAADGFFTLIKETEIVIDLDKIAESSD